jgi:hypothetical protein
MSRSNHERRSSSTARRRSPCRPRSQILKPLQRNQHPNLQPQRWARPWKPEDHARLREETANTLLVDTSKILQQTLSSSGKDEQARSVQSKNAHYTTVPSGKAERMRTNEMLRIPPATEGNDEAQNSSKNENTLLLPAISANAL